jgi:transketolase
MIKKAIRQEYGEALADLGKENSNIIVLDCDVSNSTRSIEFALVHPDRFINLGIAEANMVSFAAGLSTLGFIPVVNTFSFLLCERALDQIRSNVAYNKLNVKLAANYGGLSDSYDGPSHQSITDLAIIRSIPGMTLIVISDAICMRKALKPICEYNGPVYFRICRAETPVIHDDNYNFEIGKGNLIRRGNDITIVVTGILLYRAMCAAEELKKKGIDARVIEIHTIKPIDKNIIKIAADETRAILICEEFNIIGGLGSAVAEIVSKESNAVIDFIGLNDCYAESGAYEELLDKYGMSVGEMVRKAELLFQKKKTCLGHMR